MCLLKSTNKLSALPIVKKNEPGIKILVFIISKVFVYALMLYGETVHTKDEVSICLETKKLIKKLIKKNYLDTKHEVNI